MAETTFGKEAMESYLFLLKDQHSLAIPPSYLLDSNPYIASLLNLENSSNTFYNKLCDTTPKNFESNFDSHFEIPNKANYFENIKNIDLNTNFLFEQSGIIEPAINIDAIKFYEQTGIIPSEIYNQEHISQTRYQHRGTPNLDNLINDNHHFNNTTLNNFTDLSNQSSITSTSSKISLTPTASTYSLHSDLNEGVNLVCDMPSSSFVPSEAAQDNPYFSFTQPSTKNFLWNCQSLFKGLQEGFQKNNEPNSFHKAKETLANAFSHFMSTLSNEDDSNSSGLLSSHDSSNIFEEISNRKFKFPNNGTNYSTPPVLAHPDEFFNPSSFLKIYGDPLCGSDKQPFKGVDGNWECRSCKNINYPRRFKCNICNSLRDKDGDTIVSNYVKKVYNHYKAPFSKISEQTLGKPNLPEEYSSETIKSHFQINNTSRNSTNKKKLNNTLNRKKPPF